MKFRYRLWCPDCLGEDPQGCFGGGVEDDDERFDTYQEAEDAAWEVTKKNIWEFEVVEVPEDNQGK